MRNSDRPPVLVGVLEESHVAMPADGCGFLLEGYFETLSKGDRPRCAEYPAGEPFRQEEPADFRGLSKHGSTRHTWSERDGPFKASAGRATSTGRGR